MIANCYLSAKVIRSTIKIVLQSCLLFKLFLKRKVSYNFDKYVLWFYVIYSTALFQIYYCLLINVHFSPAGWKHWWLRLFENINTITHRRQKITSVYLHLFRLSIIYCLFYSYTSLSTCITISLYKCHNEIPDEKFIPSALLLLTWMKMLIYIYKCDSVSFVHTNGLYVLTYISIRIYIQHNNLT